MQLTNKDSNTSKAGDWRRTNAGIDIQQSDTFVCGKFTVQHIVGREKMLLNAPLVFVHGWGSESTIWRPLLAELKHQRDVYLVDLPGFGTNAEYVSFSLDSLLSEIKNALPERYHLIGWSLGGMIATRLAVETPSRIASLVTIASNAKFSTTDDWPRACHNDVYRKFYSEFRSQPQIVFQRFTQLQAKGDSCRKKVVSFLRDAQLPPKANVIDSWSKALEWLDSIDNREALKNLSVPHLAIFGQQDALVPCDIANTFFDEGFNTENIIIEHAGHAPHISQTNKVASILRDFLDKTEKRCVRDKQQVAASFSLAAKNYDAIAELQRRAVTRLRSFKQTYDGNILDLGCGTGFCIDSIKSQSNTVWGVDIAAGMLNFCRDKLPYMNDHLVCGDIEKLPVADATVDGIVSSMSIQWCENLSDVFNETARVLKKEGWLLISTLGPDTLHELRSAWYEVDQYVHINHFENAENILFALEQAGFRIHRHMREMEVLEYTKVLHLMRELKGIGAHNVNAGQNKGLTTRSKLQQLETAYEKFRIGDFLPASYEVYYFLAKLRS